MTTFFYLLVMIAVIICQTVIAGEVGNAAGFYDLSIPFLLYLGLFRPIPEGMAAAVVLGLIMDGLSAGPTGLYLTSHLWVYCFIKGSTRVIQLRNPLLFPVLIMMGVWIQNFLWMTAYATYGSISRFPPDDWTQIGIQSLWALLTGPVIFFALKTVHRACLSVWTSSHP